MGNLSEESEERLGDYGENPDPPEDVIPPTINVALLDLLRQAVWYEAEAFETDYGLNGGDLIDFYSAWRKRVLAEMNKLDGLPEDTPIFPKG